MEDFELPIDFQPYIDMINPYISSINLVMEQNFWDWWTTIFIYFGGYVPIATTGFMAFFSILFFPIAVLMIGFTWPIYLVLGAYWYFIVDTIMKFESYTEQSN